MVQMQLFGTRFLPRDKLGDLIAGLSVASILLPEAVAYATIAHLGLQHAITALLVGLVCYAWLGGSQFAIVAPTSSSAALLSAVVISLHPSERFSAAHLGFGLVILTGLGLLVFAKAGLGRLSAFVSRPVLHGFSFALALTIIAKQLPVMVGYEAHGADPLRLLIDLLQHSQQWRGWSALVGFSALALLFGLKRWTNLPGAFIVLVAGIALSGAVNLAELPVAIVGVVDVKSPRLDFPPLPLEKWLQLAELSCGLLVIIVAESWGSIRSLSLSHGHEVNPNRELFALGAANLASGLLQGLPVGAGFSASTANEQAGAQSKWAGAFAAILLLLVVLFARQWLALMPEPIVAAAVINALSHSANPRALFYLWRMNRDQYLALSAVVAVLAFGVLHGMLIAIALSLASAIRSFSQPKVKELAEIENSRDYVDKDNHPHAKTHDHILILRPEEPLFFANVEGVLAEVQRRLRINPQVSLLILSLEESANLDSTAAESLIELADKLEQKHIRLLLARAKDPIWDLLLKVAHRQFEGHLFWSVDDAVQSAKSLI